MDIVPAVVLALCAGAMATALLVFLLTRSSRRKRRAVVGSAGILALLATAVVAIAPASGQPVVTEEVPAFRLIPADLRFILDQIEISEAHAHATVTGNTSYTLLCQSNQDTTGKCVRDPMLPHGLRTVDGSFNNLEFDTQWGAANRDFPRMLPIEWRDAEAPVLGGPPNPPGATDVCDAEDPTRTCYAQTRGFVYDSDPRMISNIVVDNTWNNPAAVAAFEDNPDGEVIDELTGEFYLPNRTPDEELSAPVNMWFVLFGQFFDHGLDLVNKGGSGQIIVPLRPDDPLWDTTPEHLRFMILDRATNDPGPDGVLGTDDDVREHENRTTPFVDQNQTYTSHPSHQVFLREYTLVDGRPVDTGRLLDGANGGLATWNDVKAQARDVLGIDLTDADVLNVPAVYVDYYGNFVPGPHGFPQLLLTGPDAGMTEGDLADPVSTSTAIDLDQSFLDDIAHGAVPQETEDEELCPEGPPCLAGYDNVLLGEHFVTGDGRGNENIGLTAVHHVFHAEHNRLVGAIQATLDEPENADLKAAYESSGEADDWSYAQRIFQAARFGNEMQYQHLVFEEFARTVQPAIDVVVFNENSYDTTIDPSIKAEFAHAVYRFGHSMLTEDLAREGFGAESSSLLDGFLNPVAFHCAVQPTVDNECAPQDVLTPQEAAGALVNGTTNQPASQVDELVTSVLRNNLLGLPLDLPAINLMRGRDVGLPPLQVARETFFAETGDPQLRPYANWEEYGAALRNGNNFGRGGKASMVNFIAAYGTHPSVQEAATITEKRAAAEVLVHGTSQIEWVERLAGETRYATAAALSRASYVTGAPVVYIATGQNFPDALAAGPAAAAAGGPLLLVNTNAIPAVTALELHRLAPQRIVLLGGTSAITEQVSNSLETYTTTGEVTRLAGADRYDTAAEVSRSVHPDPAAVDTVYIASGADFPDALAAGPLAAADGAPLLLVRPGSIPPATAAELARLDPTRIVVVGGPAAVSQAVQDGLGAHAPTTRIAGDTRYETAVELSRAHWPANGGGTVYVTTGANFPDALAASPVAGTAGSPILLVPGGGTLPDVVAAEIQRLGPDRVVLVGGPEAVNDGIQEAIEALFAQPVAPADRTDFLRGTGAWANEAGRTTTGLEDVDFWVGGLAEAVHPFGGMLGTTFNYVFEKQLEDLQFGDRFYYLFRNQGEQIFSGLEANTFSSLIQRNTTASLLPADIFVVHDPFLDLEDLPDPLPEGLGITTAGCYVWNGDEHIEMHGDRLADDCMIGGQGDDALWGYGGDDRIEGGSGNDSIVGGQGNDILTDAFGDDNIKGGDGNDYIDGGPGVDLLLGGFGDDFVVKTHDNSDGAGGFLGPGDDIFLGGTGRDNFFGGEGDDWMEGGPHADLLLGDNGQQFQDDVRGGHDVLIGGTGSDDLDAEGGDDIMVGGVGGTDRYHGMFGFDYVTYDGVSVGVDADLQFNLLQPPDVTAIRDRYLQVEALSGGQGNDVVRGLGDSPDDLAAEEVNKLTEEGLARIDGLAQLLRPPAATQDYALRFLLDPLLQDNDGVSSLLLGGAGSDLMEGRFGNDYIDGDAVLRVFLEYDGERYRTARDLQPGVLSGAIDPGDITVVREVVIDPEASADDVDTAVYVDPFHVQPGDCVEFPDRDTAYDVNWLHGDYYEVVHRCGAEFEESEGQDVLRGIELLSFSDGRCFELAPAESGVQGDPAVLVECPTLGFVTFEGQIDPPTEDEAIVATVHFENEDGVTVANPTMIRFNWQIGEVGEAWDPSPTGDSFPDTTNGRVDTFVPGDGDAGEILRVVVTFEDDDGHLRQIVSAPVGPEGVFPPPPVLNVNDEPVGLTLSTMDPVVGQGIVPSSFVDGDGLEEAIEAGMVYTWQSSADGFTADVLTVAVRQTPQHTQLGYVAQAGDVGRQIRVHVTYTDDHGTAEEITSPATNPVLGAPGG